MAQRASIRKLDYPQRCARIESIVRKQFPSIVAATGISDPNTYERALSRGLAHVNCPAVSLASIGPAASSAMTVQGLGVVTGGFAAYSDAMQSAIQSAATPDEAAANLDAVVASATNLGPADHEMLASLASLGASSVYYWYDVQKSGGFGVYGTASLQMSMFSVDCGPWCKAGWADLGGGLIGAMDGGLPGSVLGAMIGSAVEAIG